MKRLWSSMNIAFSMYSRLPAAQCDWSEDNMKYVMCFFPWVGIAIGILCYGWNALALWIGIHAPLRNAVMMAIPIAVSGGIHLDGLLDTADAMSSWRPMEKRLEILKDSHAGAFAIITCAVYFVMMYGIIDMVEGKLIPVYAFTFVVSRSLSAFSIVTFPKASIKGTVSGFSRTAETKVIRTACVIYLIICGICMVLLQPVPGIVSLLGALLTFGWYYRMAMKNFNGINGDLAGCFLSVCELVVPLALVIAGLWI